MNNMLWSQNHSTYDTKVLDSLIAVENYVKADSILNKNIGQLTKKKEYTELAKRLYYFGKIQLHLQEEKEAINSLNAFANRITHLTDSSEVYRQKHLVLARFYVYIKDYQKAKIQNLLALEETNKIPNATGDLYGLIHHNLSIDYRRIGDIKQATWHSKKSLNYYLSYPKSDPSKVLDAYNSLGGRMWDAYKIDSALYYFKKAESIIKNLEPTPINKYYHKAKTQSNISSIYSILGNSTNAGLYNEKAIKNYNRFIKSKTNGKDFFKEEAKLFSLMTIENYAADLADLGNLTRTKDLLNYVLDKKTKSLKKNDMEIAYTSLQLGNTYLRLKDYKTAAFHINKGLGIYKNSQQKNVLGLADAYYYKGLVKEFNKKNDSAKFYYEKSHALYKDIFGETYDRFYLDAMLTYSVFYSKNDYENEAIEMASNTYNYLITHQGKQTFLETSQLLNLADINYRAEKYTDALKYANKALMVINNMIKDKDSSYQIFTTSFKKPIAISIKSKIELELTGHKDKDFLQIQLNNLKEGISILEKQKAIVTEDENVSILIADNDEIFELAKEVAVLLYDTTSDSKYLKEALIIHESKIYNKIRQQLHMESHLRFQDIPEEIADKEKELKNRLNQSIKIDDNFDNYLKANNEWKLFLKSIKNQYPKYYDLKYAAIAQSLDLDNLKLIEPNTVVRYSFIDEQLLAFIIHKDDIKLFKLDTEQVLEVLKKDDQDLTKYNKLYNLLWKPFSNDIENKNVIIIPDAALFNLSFETLTPIKVNNNRELAKNCLLNKHTISYNYSLLLIDGNKSPKFFKDNFIAFTPEFNEQMKNNYLTAVKDSVFLDKAYLTLLPQPFAVDIANEYSRLFDGNSFINEKASKQVFTQQAKEHKIIHIGTHAESNNVSPELSRLIFAKTINNDSISDDNSLYTYEIYNQNLSSNLAILTACETGKPTYQPGEGMISLAHAFNYAGSESILTSLWKIDEQSSAKITESFYTYLKDGLSKDKALQKAKLDYLSTAEGRTLSPQYWAGLVLIGDTSPIDISTSSNLWIWILLGILIIAMVVFLIKGKKTSTL
ncbi:CHAT domain-containing protein [Winogradskyella flava]|uniref:CHAT domain-containing protein n=1 Tax=Winogradskyella flava TaxID=1884876 RepID=UPI002491B338|nr:CHAT domain-containing protein [Winogradskyella flava]